MHSIINSVIQAYEKINCVIYQQKEQYKVIQYFIENVKYEKGKIPLFVLENNMYLSKNELQEICNQEEMIKGNIARMCLSKDYEELDVEWMLAKSKIDDIHESLQKHLHDNYDKEETTE